MKKEVGWMIIKYIIEKDLINKQEINLISFIDSREVIICTMAIND
jgi:transcriptional regulator CtsR